MKTHDQLVKAMMKRPGVKAEADRIEREESVLLDALLKARYEAGQTQATTSLTPAPISAPCPASPQAAACLPPEAGRH
jgi:hypothetical protein